MAFKYYKTKEEAQKILKSTNFTPKEFCPLIKNTCRTDCICYIKTYITNVNISNKIMYRIVDGYCDNAMFTYNE